MWKATGFPVRPYQVLNLLPQGRLVSTDTIEERPPLVELLFQDIVEDLVDLTPALVIHAGDSGSKQSLIL